MTGLAADGGTMSLIHESARATLRRSNLLGHRLVVGVSGGADSLALLLALRDLRDECDLSLVVAHLDHQMRAESPDDARFVAGIGRELGLPVELGVADVRSLARSQRLGREAAARRARYDFLGQVARRHAAAAVAVGHTLDDQTETRLLHLVRGSGLRGLQGMAEETHLLLADGARLRVIRPLLAVRRADTEAFCRERGVEPCRDRSNLDRSYRRNLLRHEVVPTLRSLNPQFDEALGRLAGAAADAEAFVEAELDRRLDALARIDSAGWTVDRSAWRDLPGALKRALLRRAAAALDPASDPGSEAIEAAVIAADTWPAGRTLVWPGEREVRIGYDRLRVTRRGATPAVRASVAVPNEGDTVIPLGPLPATLQGRLAASEDDQPGWLLRTRRRARPCPARGDRWHADLDRATLDPGAGLELRARRAGDWLAPEGMVGRKKVQDLLVDAHVARDERDAVPLLASRQDVVWVVGLCRDRRFLATPDSTDVLCLEVVAGEGGARS